MALNVSPLTQETSPGVPSYRRIWKVAYPIIIGLVAQNLMVVIDTAFLGQLGEITLGAAAIGGIFYLCMVMLGTGFSVGAQIMIGRRNGERRFRNIGRLFDHTLYVMLFLALMVFLFLTWVAPAFLKWFLSSEAVTQEGILYLQYRRYGIFFGFLNLCFQAFYVGIIRTRLLAVSTALMAMVNVVLDYLLIFGHAGFPAMGIAGAALATNIAELVTFLFFVGWSWRRGLIARFKMFRFWKLHQGLYKPLFKLAIPLMFQYFFAFSAWFVLFMIIEQISETALAASNITRSIYMLLMIPVWGLSSATSTLVSNTIGHGRSHLVWPLIKKIVALSLLSMLPVVQITLFLPETLVSFFTKDDALIHATIPIMRVISLALVAFSVGMVIFSGLSGTGKTLVALRIELSSIGIYLISAFSLVIFLDATAPVVWLVEVVYFSVMGIMSYVYLRRRTWMNHSF